MWIISHSHLYLQQHYINSTCTLHRPFNPHHHTDSCISALMVLSYVNTDAALLDNAVALLLACLKAEEFWPMTLQACPLTLLARPLTPLSPSRYPCKPVP